MKRQPLDPLLKVGHRWVGSLSNDWIRRLMIADAALAALTPVLWAGFLERRWTGKWSKDLGFKFWKRGWAYFIARLRHKDLRVLSADPYFGQDKLSASKCEERTSWTTPGSCSGCTGKHCCKVPREGQEPAVCPFYNDETRLCRIFDGLYWKVGPCGRYPLSQKAVNIYGCPRFHFPATPSAKKKDDGSHPLPLVG